MFDVWAQEYGAIGWSYEEVLPYFIKSENNTDPHIVAQNARYHGTSGPIKISSPQYPGPIYDILLNYYNSIGFPTIDVNGATQLGTGFVQNYFSDGLRSSASNSYIDPNPYPHNLHILSQSNVTKIIFKMNNSGKLVATGVEFYRNNNWYMVEAHKEIIITTGNIMSTQALVA